MWRWNGGVPRVRKGLAGCPRTPLDLPWAFDAGVGPSYCMAHHRVSSAGAKIGDRPCRKFAFPMAREGGWVGHDRSTHAGAGVGRERMIPGDTARPFVGVWGASWPCITPSNLPRVLDLGCFAPNLALPSWGFWCVAMERGVPRVMEGLAGCPRTPLDLPWAFDAGVGPSYCMAHHRVSSAGAKIGDRPCRKFAFPMAREGGWVGHDRSTHAGAGVAGSG